MTEKILKDLEPCWSYFGLSYSAYLVLPRVILCSAPVEWQDRFVAMLHELEEMFPGEGMGSYWIRKREGNRFVHDPFSNYRHMKLTPRETTPCPK